LPVDEREHVGIIFDNQYGHGSVAADHPMSSRRHFVWAFVIVSVVTAIALFFAVWLVYRLAGPE
jgi:flagellar biogenesis protein FliO